MENLPPTFKDTYNEIILILGIHNLNNSDKIEIMKIHEMRVLNWNLDDIRVSLISIANDITEKM